MADDYDDTKREILRQIESDVADFIASLDQDLPSGVPPPPKIEVTETSATPAEVELLQFGGQDTGVTPGLPSPPPPGECCNRDVEEITGIQFEGNIFGGSASPCSLTAGHNWTRIPHEDSYSSGSAQEFKLWIDADCQIQVDFNGGLPITEDCDGLSDWGGITLTDFTPDSGSPPHITLGFYAWGATAGGACTNFESFYGPSDIDVTLCDFSPLIDQYVIDDEGVDGCDATITIVIDLEIF